MIPLSTESWRSQQREELHMHEKIKALTEVLTHIRAEDIRQFHEMTVSGTVGTEMIVILDLLNGIAEGETFHEVDDVRLTRSQAEELADRGFGVEPVKGSRDRYQIYVSLD